jgi:poly(ADP-ribose) glycohydrolase
MDAICFPTVISQFQVKEILRETNKVYTSFYSPSQQTHIVTGSKYLFNYSQVKDWGCGAFRGDLQLKSVLQLMVAAGII